MYFNLVLVHVHKYNMRKRNECSEGIEDLTRWRRRDLWNGFLDYSLSPFAVEPVKKATARL